MASGGYQHAHDYPILARIPRCNRLAKAAAPDRKRRKVLATLERRINAIRSLLRVTLGEQRTCTMTIETHVDFIDACDLLKCQLSRMLALVSTAQATALKGDGTLSPSQQQEFACGLFESELLIAFHQADHLHRLWRQTGGQA